MTAEVRRVELHWALYDNAFEGPHGVHWVWKDLALSPELLKGFYHRVVRAALDPASAAKVTDALSGGVASFEDWCCWFKLWDAGRDASGRPGRFVMLAAFCRRSEAEGVDTDWVFSLDPFKEVAATIKRPPPLPELARLKTEVDAPIMEADRTLLATLRRGNGSPPFQDLGRVAGACSYATLDEDWRVLMRPRSGATAVDVELRPIERSAAIHNPPPSQRRRPIMLGAIVLGTIVGLLVIMAAFRSRPAEAVATLTNDDVARLEKQWQDIEKLQKRTEQRKKFEATFAEWRRRLANLSYDKREELLHKGLDELKQQAGKDAPAARMVAAVLAGVLEEEAAQLRSEFKIPNWSEH